MQPITRTPLRPARQYETAVFCAFCMLILGAILFFRPGWGFMDDHNNLRVASKFWQHPSMEALGNTILQDTAGGRFQPLYKLWIISVYNAGSSAPWLIYFLITLAGLLTLPFWGLILDKVFNQGRRSPFWIWIYPLAFFLFIPFWNNFMYISIQEKFVYFFSAPAIFFFLRAYENTRWGDLGWSFLCCFLAVMGKETGIALCLAFAAYAFGDAIIFRRQQRLSWVAGITHTAAFLFYYIFIKQLMRKYSAKYAHNLSLDSLGNNLCAAPFYIKILIALGLAILTWNIVRKIANPQFQENGQTLFAWLSLSYILVLLPWGFPTYLLAPLAVFVVGVAASFFQAGDRWPLGRSLQRILLVALAFLVTIFVTIPHIEKMADKRKLITAIQAISAAAPGATFFYPAPYAETATSIHIFSDAPINYLPRSLISGRMLSPRGPNYLLLNDECTPAILTDVAPRQMVYRNSTWRIYLLEPQSGHHEKLQADLTKNALQKMTALIKGL